MKKLTPEQNQRLSEDLERIDDITMHAAEMLQQFETALKNLKELIKHKDFLLNYQLGSTTITTPEEALQLIIPPKKELDAGIYQHFQGQIPEEFQEVYDLAA